LKAFQTRSPPTDPTTTDASKIEAVSAKMKIYAERLLFLAHPRLRIARTMNSAISVPRDCVISVPAKPTRKNTVAQTLDSRECRRLYAEMIAMIGQSTVVFPTVFPRRRIPAPGTIDMTKEGAKGRVRRTAAKSKSATSLSWNKHWIQSGASRLVSTMNSTTQINVRKYKIENSSDTMRPGEYATDPRNSRPRKKAILKMERVCFGIRIDRAEARRRIALMPINEIQPT
jgi:hypothetical protein